MATPGFEAARYVHRFSPHVVDEPERPISPATTGPYGFRSEPRKRSVRLRVLQGSKHGLSEGHDPVGIDPAQARDPAGAI